MASTLIRLIIVLCGLTGAAALVRWKPLALIVLGVLLAIVLLLSKLLGDLLWKDDLQLKAGKSDGSAKR